MQLTERMLTFDEGTVFLLKISVFYWKCQRWDQYKQQAQRCCHPSLNVSVIAITLEKKKINFLCASGKIRSLDTLQHANAV